MAPQKRGTFDAAVEKRDLIFETMRGKNKVLQTYAFSVSSLSSNM